MQRGMVLGLVLGLAAAGAPACGQFKADEATGKGPKLGQPLTQRLKVGVIVKAVGGSCKGISATVPVPTNWPEQKVEMTDEEISPAVKSVTYRTVSGTVRQMQVDIPQLSSGQEARALITFEITHNTVLPPDETAIYTVPKKPDRSLTAYTAPSPFIESNNAKIKSLAKEIAADKSTDWDKIEAIYDWVRDHVEYKNGELKGAARALKDKTGDCEELSSLFIAMCRSQKIPARTVWVPGHCYSEFYLVDDDGNGHWFPCQSAGTRAFGGITEQRPILQKGDNFRDPDRPRERMRYLSEHLTGTPANGGGKPQVTFVREVVGN